MLNVHLLDDISVSGMPLTYKWKKRLCMIYVVTRKTWVKGFYVEY